MIKLNPAVNNTRSVRNEIPAGPKLLRKAELAKVLRVCPRTLEHWMSSRIIPYYKIGRVVLFDHAKVMTALENFEVWDLGSLPRRR